MSAGAKCGALYNCVALIKRAHTRLLSFRLQTEKFPRCLCLRRSACSLASVSLSAGPVLGAPPSLSPRFHFVSVSARLKAAATPPNCSSSSLRFPCAAGTRFWKLRRWGGVDATKEEEEEEENDGVRVVEGWPPPPSPLCCWAASSWPSSAAAPPRRAPVSPPTTKPSAVITNNPPHPSFLLCLFQPSGVVSRDTRRGNSQP